MGARGPKGPNSTSFKPGQSGNPSGMSKVYREVVEHAKAKTIEMIDTLYEIATTDNSDPRVYGARVRAAEAILDRAFGRPSQRINKTVTHTKRTPKDIPLSELEEILGLSQQAEKTN